MSVRATAYLLLLLGVTAMAAEQPPQLDIRSLDEMEDVSGWESLASDGVSASVRSAKGVAGNALVLEFNLANTAGYAAATRKLPTKLPEDYEMIWGVPASIIIFALLIWKAGPLVKKAFSAFLRWTR